MNSKSLLLPALLVLLVYPGTADIYPRQPDIDVQHYAFRIVLTDSSDEISGEATVSIRFVGPGISEFWLDLASQVKGAGMLVTSVTLGAAPIPYTHTADRLKIHLERAPLAGDLRQFTVHYHGTPADGFHVAKNKFGERTFFSSNWPDLAHQWLPTIDHPYDKATSEFVVSAPSSYQVVANGRLLEVVDEDEGRRTTHWKQSVPICTWLDNIGVAPFVSRNFGEAMRVPLQTWVFPQDRNAGINTLEDPIRKSIEFYSDRIGEYPYEKLAVVEAAGMAGGMEHASAIFLGERSLTGRPIFGLVSHEIAHQWFGDSVTESDWDDVWLSEGFATYFTLLTSEHYDGRDTFLAGLKNSRTRIFAAQKGMPDVAVIQAKPWKGIPNAIVYQKGGWVLHMLRGQVGTPKFWEAIREYYRRFRDANASTTDFVKVVEETSGADLKWFFQQWLYRAGSPIVEGSWTYNPQSRKVEIQLEQTQPGDLYRLPLEVALGGSSPRIETIELQHRHQTFEIPADAAPATVELDPNTWILMDARFARKGDR